MFGKQTADRFDKEQISEVGPGSYDLPCTLDSRAASIVEGNTPERWEDSVEKAVSPPSEKPIAISPPSVERAEKENRAPGLRSPRGKQDAPARQWHRDLRLVSQLDMVRDELKQKSKEAKELQMASAAKDRKLEELQRKLEELAADRREAHRRAAEADGEVGAKRRALHEKEQEVQALQRKLEHARAATEERSKRAERREEEHRAANGEVLKMRQSLDAAQEQLAASEKGRGVAEGSLRQHQRRSEELERDLQSRISELEEQLTREKEARRKELEDLHARDVERASGATALQAARACQELQGKILQLEDQLVQKTSAVQAAELQETARADQQGKMEEELHSLRAAAEASTGALQRSEACREELQRQLASEQTLRQELSLLKAQKPEMDTLKAEGAALRGKVEATEKRLEVLTKDLEEEKARSEAMEKLAAEYQEKEKCARLALEVERNCPKGGSNDELEARALQAEAEAEEARQMLERWKEWGDEQQLRELAAESERLERLKQVREEVSQQVEAARQELVAENRTLHQRIVELEQGPSGTLVVQQQLEAQVEMLRQTKLQHAQAEAQATASRQKAQAAEAELRGFQADVEASLQRLDEQRLQLQRQCCEMESRAIAAEERLAETSSELERERAEAMAEGRSLEEGRRSLRVSEDRIAELEEALRRASRRVAALRWQQLLETWLRSRRDQALQEARASRARGNGQEQAQELRRLDEECEELREQNRQVLLTLQLQQQDLQAALAEARRLSDREAAYEKDLMRISERSAELGGHSNPKQKIKHLMAIKEENQSLRQELKRSRQTTAQLNGQLRAAQFFDAMTPSEPRTPGRRPPMTPMTPRRGEGDDKEQRTARAHRRASERAANAYQHLYTLVERALALDKKDSALPATPTAALHSSEPQTAEHNELYRRLRGLSLALRGEAEISEGAPCLPGAGAPTPRAKAEPEEASVSTPGRGDNLESDM
mmetsp:Transcript_98710/g.235168  ORF Transcript_98710/g.235168 Transcript_98710/m.235168 type:complete len:962 (+) Transcript_98710:78-2963(+)